MEKILLELYLSRDWTDVYITPTQKFELKNYIAERICHDPLGGIYRLYSLTPEGRTVCEFLLRKYGRETLQERGLAIESRSWHDPQQSEFSIKKMEESIRKFCKVESYRDWRPKRRRLIIKNIDEDLDSAPTPETDCDIFIFNYLDNKRKLLRDEAWVEIILWDT